MSKIAWARLVFFIGLVDVVVAASAYRIGYCDIATSALAFVVGIAGVILGGPLLQEAIPIQGNDGHYDDYH